MDECQNCRAERAAREQAEARVAALREVLLLACGDDLEWTGNDVGEGEPHYLHAPDCPNYCDFACNGDTGRKVAVALADTATLAASHDARVREEAEYPFRRALWLLHGHDGLYGDDGEMQCSRCRHASDYQRDDATAVIAAATKGSQEMVARVAEKVRAEALVEAAANRPKIVCFCGSSRFVAEMAVLMWEWEKAGHIALGMHLLPWDYAKCEDHLAESQGVAAAMDELHLKKIDLADEVFVVNVDGYVGESTRREIDYATKLGKPIRWLEPPSAPPAESP